MARPVWFVNLIKKIFPARFRVAQWTGVSAFGRILDHWLFEGDDVIYLPRDNIIQVNQSIELPEDVVLPSQVVEHFVEQASYHWVMNFCLCRYSNECQDYPIELGCLFLGEAVLGINPKFGRLVTKEEALAHLHRCQEAGLIHMIGRNKLDTVWLGIGPGQKLLTICHCCPCCCLWRALPYTDPMIADKVTGMDGVTVTVTDRCVGCGACTRDICFVDAIRLAGDPPRAVIGEICVKCGRCIQVCPEQAIELSIDDDRFVERAIARLSPLVDLS